ncbi:HdeA/HdeB family chaperone [Desulfovibrio inopinatus]|uniref:HdeA/HdeB family chaperone n=1 Tax=Desulfovibrio inopinatus TaxID=102109 RepID=UPI000427B852|nr:HdeA/HdeB family chaperone [Desulfovibrio inopinatus]
MKRFGILLSALLCLVFLSSPSYAKKGQGVDMGEYTCGDLMKERPEDVGLVLMWVDGYISNETGDLTLDEEWIMELAQNIGEACAGQPDVYLIDVVEKITDE